MIYSIRYQPRAGKEYSFALSWYRDKSIQTSINFSRAVRASVTASLEEPGRYRKTYKDFRELSLKKFPFILIYAIDEERKIVVLASIFHKNGTQKPSIDV